MFSRTITQPELPRTKRAADEELVPSEIRVYEHFVAPHKDDDRTRRTDDEDVDEAENDDDYDTDDQRHGDRTRTPMTTTTTTKRPTTRKTRRRKTHFQVLKNTPHHRRDNDDDRRSGSTDDQAYTDNGNSQTWVALEAKDLANDEFFHRQQAKSTPSLVGEPAGDDVELIEPAITTGGKRLRDVDRGVEFVQGRKGYRPTTDRQPSGDSHKRYKDDGDGDEEEATGGDAEEDHEEDDDDDDDDGKPRMIQYTRNFDTKSALLAEVKAIVKENEKLAKQTDGDVYWEVEYEHPRY